MNILCRCLRRLTFRTVNFVFCCIWCSDSRRPYTCSQLLRYPCNTEELWPSPGAETNTQSHKNLMTSVSYLCSLEWSLSCFQTVGLGLSASVHVLETDGFACSYAFKRNTKRNQRFENHSSLPRLILGKQCTLFLDVCLERGSIPFFSPPSVRACLAFYIRQEIVLAVLQALHVQNKQSDPCDQSSSFQNPIANFPKRLFRVGLVFPF